MVKSVTWLYGTSGVGKTSLIATLQERYGFLPYKCSAFDAVKTAPELLVGGKTDYVRMVNDFEYALEVQSVIGSFFLSRLRDLVDSVLSGVFEEDHIAVERSLHDPITYMIAYLALYKSNPDNAAPSALTLRTYSDLMVRLSRAMSAARAALLDGAGVYTSVTHIPINPEYPYDMADGVRPPKVVRDRVETVACSIAGNNTRYLPGTIHTLRVGHVDDYAEAIYKNVTRARP